MITATGGYVWRAAGTPERRNASSRQAVDLTQNALLREPSCFAPGWTRQAAIGFPYTR